MNDQKGSVETLPWYCIQIHPQSQSIATRNLTRQGYEHFFGTRVIDQTNHPLFKGYGFVAFDPTKDRWHPVNNTRGVIRLLPAPLRPQPLPQGFVEALITNDPITQDTTIIDLLTEYIPGLQVEITEGPYQNRRALVVKGGSNQLIEIVFQTLALSARVVLHSNSLRPVEPQPDAVR